jgi:hypothetical protein
MYKVPKSGCGQLSPVTKKPREAVVPGQNWSFSIEAGKVM